MAGNAMRARLHLGPAKGSEVLGIWAYNGFYYKAVVGQDAKLTWYYGTFGVQGNRCTNPVPQKVADQAPALLSKWKELNATQPVSE